MSVVTEFAVPPSELPLEDALEAHPDVTIELQRVVPSDQGPMPFFFAWTDEPRSFERDVRDDPAIDQLIVIERFERGALYRIEWDDRICKFAATVLETKATLYDGVGTTEQWEFELRFPSRDAASRFRERIRERGIDVELTRLASGEDVRGEGAGTYALTDEQYETLVVAFERGYFDEPRTTSLADLARELNVSTTAAAGRLRRATATLVSNTIMQGRTRPD